MKILQVIPYFSWSYGGPVRVVYDLAHKLAQRNHDVTIYTTDVGRIHRVTESEKMKVADNVDIRYFKCLSNYAASRLDLHLSRQMQTALKREIGSFDIVHTHEWRGFPSTCVWHYAQTNATPYLLQAHGALPKRLEQQRLSFILSKYVFDMTFGHKIMKAASKAIALTSSEAEQYQQLGVNPNHIAIVPNGIDLSNFEKLPPRGSCRKRYSIGDDERIILFVGRLHKTKGLKLLLQAFKDASNKIGDFKLIIMGPDAGFGTILADLVGELQLSGQVLFTGWVPHHEKIEALVDSELFVTPQFHGFPVTFLEACACGTPILTTEKGDKLDWIDGEVGLVVRNDKNDLSDAIIRILQQDNLREAFGKRAQQVVRDQFSLDRITDKMEMLYEECVL